VRISIKSKTHQCVVTMANECDVSKIVPTFFLNTCRLPPCPWPTKHGLLAAARCAAISTEHPPDDQETEAIPLTTGSVAEFYIEPMLPHVGDVDVMFHANTKLAIPEGHPPPTQLPTEFHNYVTVYKIIDSHLLSYVYIRTRYLLTQCRVDGKYKSIEYDERLYLSHRANLRGKIVTDQLCLHRYSVHHTVSISVVRSFVQ